MKTKKLITVLLIASVFFPVCENPVGLGDRIDFYGPVLEIISPVTRKAVASQFEMSGTVSDKDGVMRVLITAQMNNINFAKQWRFEGSNWEVSENYGASWAPLHGSVWQGDGKNISWSLPINMMTAGMQPPQGEYNFTVQAWDVAENTDDNSMKTRVLIFDYDPPAVEISRPYLFDKYSYYDSGSGSFTNNAELNTYHGYANTSSERTNQSNMGKFLTRGFDLQWQIEDQHNIWSIELRFYDLREAVDHDKSTTLSGDYYYRYWQNLGPPPPAPVPELYPKPNGTIKVPDLNNAALKGSGAALKPDGTASDGFYEFKTEITQKTTVRVVGLCMDAAGNVSQERTLGFFIFWPLADYPWIVYMEGMNPPSNYNNYTVTPVYKDDIDGRKKYLDDNLFMIYPGRNIKATAFHPHGVREVEYSLHEYEPIGGVGGVGTGYTIGPAEPLSYLDTYGNLGFDYEFTDSSKTKIKMLNPPRNNNVYSTIFPFDFRPPAKSAYYVIKAVVKSDEKSSAYEALFRVQDITFPIFDEIFPIAGEPLYKDITNNVITIRGSVTDATRIEFLTMVWINQQSKDWAAMSQLEYFRNQEYAGWADAKRIPKGGTRMEDEYYAAGYPYDIDYPNRLWNLNFTAAGEDEDGRKIFTFSVPINITNELNIGGNTLGKNNPLRSQMFLLRAENPDGRTSIITYAPQGDTSVPSIKIDRMTVQMGANTYEFLTNKGFEQVPMFTSSGTITVHGSWEEDSTAHLDIGTYFSNRMVFEINGNVFPAASGTLNTTRSVTPPSGNAASGTFVFSAVTGTSNPPNLLQTSTMKDTLVVKASVEDIGGNPAEDTFSWLIQSERLKFLRISSDNPDKIYKVDDPLTADDDIEIFLEFSKPVRLKNYNYNSEPAEANRPQLILSTTTGGPFRAVYKAGQNIESTKQFFVYKVQNNHNAYNPNSLDLTGLYNNGNISNTAGDANTEPNYPFAFVHKGEGNSEEEVRITMRPDDKDPNWDSNQIGYVLLPNNTTQNRSGSLRANKQIEIDTRPITVSSVSGNPQGWHRFVSSPTEIHITVNFSKDIKAGTGAANEPKLVLSNVSAAAEAQRTTSAGRASGSSMSFTYTVKNGDNTNGNALQIEKFTGKIFDIPGAELTAGAFNTVNTITGVYIDTAAPAAPTFNLQNGSDLTLSTGMGYLANATSGGTGLTPWTPGTNDPTGANIVTVGDVYANPLKLEIVPSSSAANTDLYKLEYSTNFGKDWAEYTNGTKVNWGNTQPNGSYNITARQTDRAGNVSDWAKPVCFTWDKGDALVTSITSPNPSIVHTKNNSRSDSITIYVNFRKPLKFSTTPRIILNIQNPSNATANNYTHVDATGYTLNSETSQLTFVYAVKNISSANRDNTPGSDILAVTGFSNINAKDQAGVTVDDGITLPGPANNLSGTNITVKTGDMGYTGTPAFGGATVLEDNSVNTTFTVNFTTVSGGLIRGSGNMTVTQEANGYRIPSVLTESKRSKYGSMTTLTDGTRSAFDAFDYYYKKGVNGFKDGVGPDTSAKYILRYSITPSDITADSSGSAIEKFADSFRLAEKITIGANEGYVIIPSVGASLTVTINGLQVPGANYEVTIPAGFVRDAIGNESPLITISSAVGGVATPNIRIKKDPETITRNASVDATTPRFVPSVPFQTKVKMDCRTPGADIRYNSTALLGTEGTTLTNVTDENWYTVQNRAVGNNATAVKCAADNATGPWPFGGVISVPARQTQPTGSGVNVGTLYNNELTIGPDNSWQGFIWRVNARSFKGAGSSNASYHSEEVAYRTVLTIVIQQMAGTGTRQVPHDGSQLWLRGGDEINVSSIPGYPLTWADDWAKIESEGSRAGIRLMSRTGGRDAGNNSNTEATWKWLSWEITVDTYFDFMLGRDDSTTTDTNIIRQYGPKERGYNVGGWVAWKKYYRMQPGQHRWVNTYYPRNSVDNLRNITPARCVTVDGYDFAAVGGLNFSATWEFREKDNPAYNPVTGNVTFNPLN